MEAYWTECQDLPSDLFLRVVRTCCRENTFMPSVGEVIAMATGKLTHERSEEKEKAYRQMKARDSYARMEDLEGFKPRKLLPLVDTAPKGAPKLEHNGGNGGRLGVNGDGSAPQGCDLTKEENQERLDNLMKRLGRGV